MSRRSAGEDPLRRMMRGPSKSQREVEIAPTNLEPPKAKVRKKSKTSQVSGRSAPRSVKIERRAKGSLGGVTTVTDAGKLRKTVYFDPEVWEALQTRAKRERSNGTAVVDAALRSYLELDL